MKAPAAKEALIITNPVVILLIGMTVVVGAVLFLRLHAFLALMAGAITVATLTPTSLVFQYAMRAKGATEAAAHAIANMSLGERLALGFSDTVNKVGLLIAMASIVGRTLLDSGAAERIVHSIRSVLGDRRSPLVFLISGFLLGGLVFAETVFYLLIPLAKVMRIRSGHNYTLYVLTIVAGATMTHSLVPPTPGPSYVAEKLGISLATMIPCGIVIGAIAASSGFAFAVWANKRWDIPLRATAGLTERDLDAIASRDESTLPPLWLALLPVVLPVLLISGSAIATKAGATGRAIGLLNVIGDKNIALTIAAAIGLLMLSFSRGMTRREISAAVGEALAGGGVIILIIAAGGAFGLTLQQTDIGDTIKQMLPRSQFALIPLAFLAAVLIRTAQGSATVSMITTVGIVAPIVAAAHLPYHPVYLALAIGCGSKPGMWMNDAGFWIIGKMSGFTEGETLKTATVMNCIMGVVGLGATLIGAWLVPLT